jgi:integrase
MRAARPIQVTISRFVHPKTGERVAKSFPGAKRIVEKSETWYAWIHGKRVALDTTDEGKAWENLRAMLRAEKESAAGIRDTYTEAAGKPLSEHITAWIETVKDSGSSEARLALLESRINYLAKLANWKRLSDLTPESCLSALTKISKQIYAHTELTRSAQTRNHYLSHAKQFARFLWETKRLREHIFLRLRPINVELDRRHDRRAPSSAEIAKLFAHAPLQPFRSHMTGIQRVLGYKLAMATGLRASELRSLTRESFDLDNKVVTLRAAYDKRGRKVHQPIPDWLRDELREWFDAGGGLWSGFPKINPGRILQDDLKRAGIAYEIQGPDGPLFFDFHALRHWYVTQLANLPSISPKTLMTLCRHSTPSLTMKVYAKARTQDLENAVSQMANPSPKTPDQKPLSEN